MSKKQFEGEKLIFGVPSRKLLFADTHNMMNERPLPTFWQKLVNIIIILFLFVSYI